MRSQLLGTLLVVALCVGGLPLGGRAQEDANRPWDPAEHLAAFWESVVLSAQLYNPTQRPDRDPNMERRLSVLAGARTLDKVGLIGIETTPGDIVARDQGGVEIVGASDGPSGRPGYRSFRRTEQRFGPEFEAEEFRFSLGFALDPNGGNPSSLRHVEWTLGALVGGRFAVVEVAFEPNETWIELVPGLDILVGEASVDEGGYAYRIEAVYDAAAVSYPAARDWELQAEAAPPATILLEMELLNAASESVHDLGPSRGSGGSTTSQVSEDGLTIATSRGSGRCGACGEVTTIRYTFAVAAYELEARFVLEDVPVPGF